MPYYYWYHRNEKEAKFEQDAKICREAGMSENKIQELYRHDLDELNSDRRYATHTQSYDSMKFPDNEDTSVDKNPLMDKFLENFSAAQVEISEWGRMDWINDLDTPEIIIWVQNLDESDQLLLTLLVVDNLRKTDAAKIMKKHDSAISRKLKKLRESLAKILSDGSIKQ